MIYIATFYSHFGAMRCKKMCGEAGIPARMGACVNLTPQEALQLYTLLYKLLDGME